MKRPHLLACLAAMAVLYLPQAALAQRAEYEAMVATHASANGVPPALVHRVIVRESRYQPRLVGRGGTIGLMQIKLGTARALGYRGDAAGLLDAETNMTYAVKYLAGAYRAAGGNADRAVHYYAAGYYYATKRKGLRADTTGNPLDAYAAAPARAPAVSSMERLREAKAVNPDASSASDLYTGRIDIPR